VRLRLKRAAVDRIATGQSVEEHTCIAGSALICRLEFRGSSIRTNMTLDKKFARLTTGLDSYILFSPRLCCLSN